MREKIKRDMLNNLYIHRYWGGKHTSAENAMKGIPRHLAGEAKDVLKELLKEGLLIPKPTHYGFHVSLNPRKKREIEEVITSDKAFIFRV